MLNFENLDKFHFAGEGKFDIPVILPEIKYPPDDFIPMNYAKTEKKPEEKAIHCFVDDYQFVRFWNQPDRYIPMLQKFKAVLAPESSLI